MADLLKLVDYFTKESAVIAQAPAIFITALILVGGLIWVVVNRSFSLRLTNAESSKGLLEDRIRDYQEKLNGATPKEAQAQIAELRAAVARLEGKQNFFSDDQLHAMKVSMNRYVGTITVSCDVEHMDSLTQSKANQMARFLEENGWDVERYKSIGIERPPLHGIVIIERGENGKREGELLKTAFDAAGIPYEVRAQPAHDSIAALQLNFSDDKRT